VTKKNLKNSESVQAEAAPDRVLLKPEKKIAIVGCSDSKDQAPFNDPSWEIWAMNNAFITTPRRTRWFEIHPIKFDGKDYWRRKLIKPGIFEYSKEFRGQLVNDYMKDLAALDIPVYMQRHWDIIPKSEAYPLQDVITKFGNYFTNSVSYMIALAIMEGATEIGCFGVDMATGSEYGPQRPSCEFFLGIAAGLGILLTIPPTADLLKTKFLYGFQEREQVAWEAKLSSIHKNMETRKAHAQQEYDLAFKKIQQYVGGLEVLKETERAWSNIMTQKTWSDPV
jgi:hypothetical protein